MKNPRVLSLRLRLIGLLGLLLLIAAPLVYWAAVVYGRSAADASYDRLLSGSVISIAESLSFTRAGVLVDIPYAALDMLSIAPEDKVFYRIYVTGGRTITGYDDLPQLRPSHRSRKQGDPMNVKFFTALYRGEGVRFAVLDRETFEPGMHGTISVEVGQTMRAREAMATQLVLRAMFPILFVAVYAIIFIWFGIGVALRPLARIGADLVKRDSSDLNAIERPVPTEMAPLVGALNSFMHRLQANIDALRAFIGEAAHQIRTPLAALRAQAQVADGNDIEDLRHSLQAVERNAAKLTRLINQLLSDAIVTHRADVVQFESFDLTAMIRQALREVVPVSGDVEIGFQTNLDAAPFIGDRLLLSEAMKNVIDNAIQHGGGDITIGLIEGPEQFFLTVCDRGPGIPDDKQAEVWERFARAGGVGGGAGLGLAIVRRAIERHQGHVELRKRLGGGLCVKMFLPRNIS